MQVLLDESVPRGLRRLLPDHEVCTVPEQGWKSYKNGRLLAVAQKRYDVLVTADRGFEHEQNLAQFRIAVVILVARSNRMIDYEPLAGLLRVAVTEAQLGEARTVAVEPSE